MRLIEELKPEDFPVTWSYEDDDDWYVRGSSYSLRELEETCEYFSNKVLGWKIRISKDGKTLFTVDLRNFGKEPADNVGLSYDLTDDGTGKKYDGGKPMVGALCRVFPHALLAVGQCIEFGTHKYPQPDNWKLVEGAFTRYQDSMMRHYLKYQAGEIMDSETKLPHLSHMAWNALAILELYLMNNPEIFKQYLK